MPSVRVISLVPSVTETLLAWGVVPVAVTRFCEQPGFPTVGGTKDPDVAAIIALGPDVVVMDEEENRREDHDALVAGGVPVHVTAVRALDDVDGELARLAARVGVPGAAAGAANVRAHAPEPAPARRRAFVPIWKRPWMTINGDTYGATVLAAVGVDTLFATDPRRYPTVTLDEVAERRPELVVLPSEPYPFAERHRADVAALGVPVVLVDGRDLFWWGARTSAAVDRLRALLR